MRFSPGILVLAALLCSVAVQALVVSVKPRQATVRQGESLSFRCQVSGGASTTALQWSRANNQPMPGNIKIGPDGIVLTVTNARPGNRGSYRCTASNSTDRISATGVLNVRFAPKVQLTPPGPLRVRMGDAVTVECLATGVPRPLLTWRRQGSTLQLGPKEGNDTNVLHWPAIQPSDSGVYICKAQNSEGMTEVKVEVFVGSRAPLASVSIQEMTVVQGQTVTMSCQASGNPRPAITWSKLRAPLPWNHTMANGVLTLTNVGRQDSGQYICNATNVHGYSEAYTQMEVETPPYTTCLPHMVKLRVGEALSVQCLANGSPTIELEWSRVGQPSLPPGTKTTSDGQLFIAQVKVADSGTYKCVATNHIGSSQATAKVVVRA